MVPDIRIVTVSLDDLRHGPVPSSTLKDAFGPSSHGILIVKDLPSEYERLRLRLLTYASYLAHLPLEELAILTDAASHYEIGWSHGKERLKEGQYDVSKGSFYVNCHSFYPLHQTSPGPSLDTHHSAISHDHYHTAENIWPPEHHLPGFRSTFQELCTLVIDIGSLVARACDQYVANNGVAGYEPSFLERMVKTSVTTKARLLHYFPPEEGNTSSAASSSSDNEETNSSNENDDSWCATHLDDGCLTALTSALYIDESTGTFPVLDSSSIETSLPILPASPDPKAGLYIHSSPPSDRTEASNTISTKIDIPPNCLAFQTGEALQLITGGLFRAIPHLVRGPNLKRSGGRGRYVARNTLAIFMQPDLDQVIDSKTGMTFGRFANMAVEMHS